MPRFSIIVVYYQGATSYNDFLRAVRCIHSQTLKDYELICLHDGPLLDRDQLLPVPVICTERRYNDWGHSLRDIGISKATGEYILHLNADGVLYEDALEKIEAEITRKPLIRDNTTGEFLDTNEMILFPIIVVGGHTFRGRLVRVPKGDFYIYLTGHPPVRNNIDCMQLVIRRDIWLKEGGWYDKNYDGDGKMYEKFCSVYGYRTVSAVLGEHH